MPDDFVRTFSGWLLDLHGQDAPAWALGYLVTAVQKGDVQEVHNMRNILAAVVEMSRVATPGDTVH